MGLAVYEFWARTAKGHDGSRYVVNYAAVNAAYLHQHAIYAYFSHKADLLEHLNAIVDQLNEPEESLLRPVEHER